MEIIYWEKEDKFTNDHKNILFDRIIENKVIPVIGSGFTMGSKAKNGFVPNGSSMKEFFIEFCSNFYGEDKSNFLESDLATLASSFNKNAEIKEKYHYYSSNFTEVELSKIKKEFINLNWKIIYTLNYDDAIENANKNLKKFSLCNDEVDNKDFLKEYNVLFKMHGDVFSYISNLSSLKNEKLSIILDKSEYVKSLFENKAILNKFKSDLTENCLLYLGTSLSDEIDLLSVNIDFKDEDYSYFVSSEKLSGLKYDELEKYGIKYHIIVKNFENFYKDIIREKNKNRTKMHFFQNFREPKLLNLSRIESDNKFALSSNNIFDINYKNKNLQYNILKPFFFVNRFMVNQILNDIRKNDHPLFIICGKRISGKTYVLLSLYDKLTFKTRYFIPSLYKFSDKDFKHVFEEKNVVIIFDTNSLNSYQMNELFRKDKIDKLKKNNSIIILAQNTSDNYYEESILLHSPKIYRYTVNNYFSRNETEKLNLGFEACNIGRFSFSKLRIKKDYYQKTLLDNLIENSTLNNNSAYQFNLNNDEVTKKHLLFLILIATDNVINLDTIYNYSIANECTYFINKFNCIFDKIKVDADSVSRVDNRIKIICNARYCVLNWLYNFGENEYNFHILIEAYKLLWNNMEEKDKRKKIKNMLEYVKFDVLNDIYSRQNKPCVKLIKFLYESFENEMNSDFQFKHQRAKSIMRLESNSLKEMKNAANYINIAIHNAKQEIDDNPYNPYLPFSLAHLKLTRAFIYGRRANLYNFNDLEIVKKSFEYYMESLLDVNNKKALLSLKTRNNFQINRKDLAELLRFLNTKSLVEKSEIDYLEKIVL